MDRLNTSMPIPSSLFELDDVTLRQLEMVVAQIISLSRSKTITIVLSLPYRCLKVAGYVAQTHERPA